MHLLFEKDEPQLLSPQAFWQATDALYLVIDAAFHTTQKLATVMWQPFGQEDFSPDCLASFPIVVDGEFHRYLIHLGAHAEYRGSMSVKLRLDPVGKAKPSAWMKVRSVKLAASSKQ